MNCLAIDKNRGRYQNLGFLLTFMDVNCDLLLSEKQIITMPEFSMATFVLKVALCV
jgi:hypothetical protein